MATTSMELPSAEALGERLFAAGLATAEVATVHLGAKLGLYEELVRAPGLTAPELAAATGLNARYVREWLEQQAVGAIIAVDDPGAPAEERRYRLPAGYAEVLTDRDSLACLAPYLRLMAACGNAVEPVADAFRRGGGVPYADYGPDVREGIGEMNRAMFINELATDWMPGVPDVHARLLKATAPVIVDVACGTGWSTISLARAYPHATLVGVDLDDDSIVLARRNAQTAGLSDRIRFEVRDAADVTIDGEVALVTVFEAIHDMAHPVAALSAIRRLAGPSGDVIVVDERVADEFTAPGDEIERLMYCFSVLHCLPVGMTEPDSAGTGTVMRTTTFRDYAVEAGFGDVEVLPIENLFWRFYRLR